ncbi:MAG: alpha/beta fold hydrolase [Gemmatimonadales bacterium]
MLLELLQTHIAAALLAFTPPHPLSLSDTLPPWRDPSPHRELHIRVGNAVQLEVLDWGGPGKPLVFLAGGGEAAHVYDGFAPRFSGRFRVLAITRRGVGTSSHPAAGYDTTTLTHDIITVLDSLGIQKASFVGHSFAGSELNALAVRYPGRVDRLVYLDSGWDERAMFDSPEWKSGALQSPQPPEATYEDNSIFTWTLYAERVSGPGFPEAEVRALYQFDDSGHFVRSLNIDSVIVRLDRGTEAVDLRRIQAPALALYAVPGSAEVFYPWWQTLDPTARARGQKSFEAVTRVTSRLRDEFRDRVPNVRVVIIPGARHYLFLTDSGEVTHAMLEFLTSS